MKTQKITSIDICGVPCKLYRVVHADDSLGGWTVTTDTGVSLVRYAMTMQKYAIAEATDKLKSML